MIMDLIGCNTLLFRLTERAFVLRESTTFSSHDFYILDGTFVVEPNSTLTTTSYSLAEGMFIISANAIVTVLSHSLCVTGGSFISNTGAVINIGPE